MSQNQLTGIELITQERHEQVVKHHRTVAEDKLRNNEYQLVDAAQSLASPVPEGQEDYYLAAFKDNPPVGWGIDIWNSLIQKPYKERLIIAGALIAAEIDRIS